MDGTTVAAVVAAVCALLTALAGGFFGYLGKKDDKAREAAGRAEKDVETLTERIDELEHRLDVVVRAYFAQRTAVAEHGIELLAIPPEMRRASSS